MQRPSGLDMKRIKRAFSLRGLKSEDVLSELEEQMCSDGNGRNNGKLALWVCLGVEIV